MSKFDPLCINMFSQQDKSDKTYYLGRVRSSLLLPFDHGVVFKLYTEVGGGSDDPLGEELIIDSAPSHFTFQNLKKSRNKEGKIERYIVPLEKRESESGETHYVGMVQDAETILDLRGGLLIFAFISRPGLEQLQLVKYVPHSERQEERSAVEE